MCALLFLKMESPASSLTSVEVSLIHCWFRNTRRAFEWITFGQPNFWTVTYQEWVSENQVSHLLWISEGLCLWALQSPWRNLQPKCGLRGSIFVYLLSFFYTFPSLFSTQLSSECTILWKKTVGTRDVSRLLWMPVSAEVISKHLPLPITERLMCLVNSLLRSPALPTLGKPCSSIIAQSRTS